MSDDGGPAYPSRETFVTLKDGQIADAEDYRWCPGMSLREQFAVSLMEGWGNSRIEDALAKNVFDSAQKLTDEALARRKQDEHEGGDEVKA